MPRRPEPPRSRPRWSRPATSCQSKASARSGAAATRTDRRWRFSAERHQPEARRPPIALWEQLVREVRSAREERIVISDENFSFADPPTVARVVHDLDPERLRIAITLRHLGSILPSHWQQNVQVGITESYDEWLRAVLGTPSHRFWVTQRHDVLVRRWVNEIGVDRVTVVAVNEDDRGMLYRTFEALLGLRAGTLPEIASGANRSLTLPEAEAVRAFNVAAHHAGISPEAHARYMRFGAAARLKRRRPAPTEARVQTPAWAMARARDLGLETVTAIEATGVQTIGDVASLTADRRDAGGVAASGPASESIAIPPDVVGTLAFGVMRASSPRRVPIPLAGRSRQVSGDSRRARSRCCSRSVSPVFGSTGRRGAPPVAADHLPRPELTRPRRPQLDREAGLRSRPTASW